jgi:secernin
MLMLVILLLFQYVFNSDRPANESMELIWMPAPEANPATPKQESDEYCSFMKMTYINVKKPASRKQRSVLLCKPVWMSGAEMGVNDAGVSIGNEAVFTKYKINKDKKALLGMDMIVLALMYSSTAKEALDLIVELLEEYGQGGNCFPNVADKQLFYHNSFLIVDEQEQWVLETAGHLWVAEKIEQRDNLLQRSISNCLTIGSKFTLSCKDLIPYAIKHGYCKKAEELDFKKCFSDFLVTNAVKGRNRCATTKALSLQLFEKCKTIEDTVEQDSVGIHGVIHILQHHQYEQGKPNSFQPKNGGIFLNDVCAHASYGPVRISQCTNSLIVHYDRQKHNFRVFVSGTSSPCISLFKPLSIKSQDKSSITIPNLLLNAKETPVCYTNNDSLWWRGEVLHRLVLLAYEVSPFSQKIVRLLNDFKDERTKLQQKFIDQFLATEMDKTDHCKILSEKAFVNSTEFTNEWVMKLEKTLSEEVNSIGMDLLKHNLSSALYIRYWIGLNKRVNIHQSNSLDNLYSLFYRKQIIAHFIKLSIILLPFFILLLLRISGL